LLSFIEALLYQEYGWVSRPRDCYESGTGGTIENPAPQAETVRNFKISEKCCKEILKQKCRNAQTGKARKVKGHVQQNSIENLSINQSKLYIKKKWQIRETATKKVEGYP